jgi:20S proteasome alpha/beta subunit
MRPGGTKQMIEAIEDIDPNINDEAESLTTILAIKCPDGIVMSSDSQATLGKMKTLGVSKISDINHILYHIYIIMAVGGSGDADNIILFVDYLTQSFTQMSLIESHFRDKMEKFVTRLHKKYNQGLNINRFNPTLLLGAKNANNSFGLYLLRNGMVYPKNDYVVEGSGGDLARLVIKQLNRSMATVGGSLHEMSVEGAVPMSCYIINEVKESDSKSGGETQVAVIDAKGVRILPPDEVQSNYNEFQSVMTLAYASVGIHVEDSKKILPPL